MNKRKPEIMRKLVPSVVVLSALTMGCARALETRVSQQYDPTRKLTVAVLPFTARNDKEQEGADLIRRGLIANLRNKTNLEFVEITTVDALLKARGWEAPDVLKNVLPHKLGETLGVDAVIYGGVVQWKRLYALIHSDIEVEAWVKMVDTRTGEILWEAQKGEIRNAGLVKIPTGYVAVAVAPIMGLRKVYLYNLTHDLCRNLAAPLKYSFPSQKDQAAPLVTTAAHNIVKKKPLRSSDILKVVAIGKPGQKALFYIGNFKTHLPMREYGKGEYIGSYRVLPGDHAKDVLVTVFLLSNEGKKSSLTINRSISIDGSISREEVARKRQKDKQGPR